MTHVDGTGRLQTVDRTSNARYYAVIESFFQLTGVPMVLNTSFNENEPVVCRPEEALECFLRTKMDVLVLGNHLVRRDAAAESCIMFGRRLACANHECSGQRDSSRSDLPCR